MKLNCLIVKTLYFLSKLKNKKPQKKKGYAKINNCHVIQTLFNQLIKYNQRQSDR